MSLALDIQVSTEVRSLGHRQNIVTIIIVIRQQKVVAMFS